MSKCEDRLRTLHPHAMARYDRLRTDGMTPLDAMRETAWLFGRSPDVRVGDPIPARPALTTTAAHDLDQPTSHPPPPPSDPVAETDADHNAELRGRQIIERLQSTARTASRPELGPDDLAMILEATTNLSYDVIQRITSQPDLTGASSQQTLVPAASHTIDLPPSANLTSAAVSDHTMRPAAAHANPGAADSRHANMRTGRSAAELAAESFPHDTAGGLQATSTGNTVRLTELAKAPVTTNAHGRPR